MSLQNLNEIGRMKQNILKAVLSDADIVKLLTNQKDTPLPALGLRYTQVFPWRKVLGTQETAKSLIGFDIAWGGAVNPAVKDYVLNIWVMVHESLMPIDEKTGEALELPDRGVRTDILCDKIDYLLNGSTDMGFGKLEIAASSLFNPSDYFCGRTLQYKIMGWNRWGVKL